MLSSFGCEQRKPEWDVALRRTILKVGRIDWKKKKIFGRVARVTGFR